MNGMEPLADVATGGLVARAVEPAAGDIGDDGHTHERNCLNCGTTLAGDYCHACGQRGHVHRTLTAFFHDLLHGVFHFEGKIWRTLPMLAWRPGDLTRRYIEGQRASFVSPMALFLFSVFLMFAALSFTGTAQPIDATGIQGGLEEEFRIINGRIATLQAERAERLRQGLPVQAIDQRVASERRNASLIGAMRKDGILKGTTVRLSDDVPDWLAKPLEKAGANPELLFFKLKTNAYKFSWMLIPLSVPFVWLLFPFSRSYRLYDHTVFVTYSLCFMTLLAVAASLWSRTGLPGAEFAVLLPPLHMYRQLKGAYGLTRAAALWRTAASLIFSFMVSGLFLLILLALGIFD